MAPKVITVPKTDPNAYNPSRSAGKLLLSQTQHLREALIKQVQELTTLIAVDLRTLKTEGELSAYIHKATALLHTHGAKPAQAAQK